MSIFYNLSRSVDIDTNDREELKFESDAGNELLLDKQSDYQVGVCRFKIPTNQVPLYRFYANELFILFE